jgi:hypothetical protein
MKRIIVHTPNDASYFMLNYTSLPENSSLGIRLAQEMVATFKRDVPNLEPCLLLGHLHAWNARGGNPFSTADIAALAATPAKAKEKKTKREVPAPGVPLFQE